MCPPIAQDLLKSPQRLVQEQVEFTSTGDFEVTIHCNMQL